MRQRGFERIEDEGNPDRLRHCPSWSATYRSGPVRLEIGQYALGVFKDSVQYHFPDQPEATIFALVTDDSGRGQRHASRALAAMVEACRESGQECIWLEPCP